MSDDPTIADVAAARMRTPRAAGVAGLVFAVLLSTTIVLVRWSAEGEIPLDGGPADDRRGALKLALHLLPFAGIAFLWFIGVVRDHIGSGEDRFFATVFLGSGLLFIAMLFASGAVAGGLVLASGGTSSAEVATFGRQVTSDLLTTYAMRMAAVFTLSTTTIALRLRIMPTWLVAWGFATGVVLLVTAGRMPWVELIFPLWVFVLSLEILVRALRPERVASAFTPSG
jgi:hypothetical protein